MSDPIDRIHNMSVRLTEVIDCLRADIGRVEEPQFKAMFETAAEVQSPRVPTLLPRPLKPGPAPQRPAGFLFGGLTRTCPRARLPRNLSRISNVCCRGHCFEVFAFTAACQLRLIRPRHRFVNY